MSFLNHSHMNARTGSPDDRESRDKGVERVLGLILVLNWLVSAVKMGVGTIAGNLTVFADGLHSLLDGANNIIGIVAIRIAARPPDEQHPYGHRKFENVASMFVGGLVMLLGWEVLRHAISSVRNSLQGHATPHEINQATSTAAMVSVVLCMVINIAVARYERRRGEQLSSSFLKADAAHTKSDAIVTLISLTSLLVGRRIWWMDAALAVIVVGFIGKAAFEIISDNVHVFTDRVQLDPAEVGAVSNSVPGVQNTHAIRSHGSEHDIHLDLHIVVDETLSASDVAEIEENVRSALQNAFKNVSLVSVHHQTHPHDPSVPLWSD
jgi:cation diffusion facilitator family transporter